MASQEERQTESIGRVFSVNYSAKKRTTKIAIEKAILIENFGLKGDAHGGPEGSLRQISLLSLESIQKQQNCPKAKKKNFVLSPGDFAENITTEGLDLSKLKINDRLAIGKQAILEISKIGKECHKFCDIYEKLGDCIMPREGIFARVIEGGEVSKGDTIKVLGGA